MSNTRKLAAALVGCLAVVAALPAAAQVDVDVSVDNPGGTRALYVEDLVGQPLTALDFGVSRTQPFRVRVVDSTMDRTGFTVSATMTNLYLDTDDGLDLDGTPIDSVNLEIVNPTAALNVLDVSALVQPVFDTVSTISDTVICTTLGLTVVLGSCTVSLSDLEGKLQTLPLTVDLGALAGLPLLPQVAEEGEFTNPDYAGVAALAPQPPSPPDPTSRRMIQGTPVSSAAVLTALQTVLNSVLASQALGDKIDTGTVTSALRSTLGVAYDLLTTTQVNTILSSTVATVEALLPSDIRAQTGTYLSFPTLQVTVPDTAAAGSYKGTLVVTGLQP